MYLDIGAVVAPIDLTSTVNALTSQLSTVGLYRASTRTFTIISFDDSTLPTTHRFTDTRYVLPIALDVSALDTAVNVSAAAPLVASQNKFIYTKGCATANCNQITFSLTSKYTTHIPHTHILTYSHTHILTYSHILMHNTL